MAWKKISASKFDFKESDLPKTRREQFVDIIKVRFSTLAKIGLIMLLFFIPFIVSLSFKDIAITHIYEDISNSVITLEEGSSKVKDINNITNLFYIISLIIIFVGISGISRVYRDLLFEDSLFFKDSFVTGLKQNLIPDLGIGLFSGLLIFSLDYIYNLNVLNSYLSGILIGIILVIVIPVFLYLVTYNTVYKNSVFISIKNSFLLYLRSIPVMLSFMALILVCLLLSLFNIIIIKLPIIVLLILFVLPIFLLALFCFTYRMFDKYINVNQYPSLVRKGLYKGEN